MMYIYICSVYLLHILLHDKSSKIVILSYLGENTDKNKKTNLKYSNISLLYDTLQGNGFQKEPLFFQGLIFRCHANLQGLSQECEKKLVILMPLLWNFQRPPVALGVDATNPRRIVWTLEKASLTRRLAEKEGMKYMKYYPAM